MGSDPRCTVPGGSAGLSGPSSGCRIREFIQYHPVALQHERDHILRALKRLSSFANVNARVGLEHDLLDVEYLLRELEKRDEESVELR